MIAEDIDRRVLAALRFIHGVTGAPILRPLRIDAPGLQLVRNLSGMTIVREARGTGVYSQCFENPPKLGAQLDFPCRVVDPQGEFLPRSFTLTLPRPTPGIDGEPIAQSDTARSPIALPLLPAAALPVAPAWALLRLAVHIDGTEAPRGLANVWVEAQPRVPGKPMRLCQTDAQGEALVAIADVGPIVGAAPLSTQFLLDLNLVLDPVLVRASPESEAERRELPLPDATTVAARRAVSRAVPVAGLQMRAGAVLRHVVPLAWP